MVDVRRINVALTRAKSSVFILGHAATLERSDDVWKKIVEDARSRELLVDVRLSISIEEVQKRFSLIRLHHRTSPRHRKCPAPRQQKSNHRERAGVILLSLLFRQT